MTYGKIALHGGNSRGARQVSRILHTCSKKEKLPWHRVVNRDGMISLPEKGGYEEQRTLLNEEGVLFDTRNRIELKIFLWEP